VRTVPDARWGVQVARGSDESILQQALLLGLCTPGSTTRRVLCCGRARA